MNSSDKLYRQLLTGGPKPAVAVLVDPEKANAQSISKIVEQCKKCKIDAIFIGGSLVSENPEQLISTIHQLTDIPVVLFPGSIIQISNNADAILLLSLISGRNPEYLIGNHVLAAKSLYNSNLQIIPTGYILIDGGNVTSVQYISNTTPIPANKPELVVATAIAGKLLGLKAIYLEAGSGANKPVSPEIISEVKKNIDIPIIVGGGIKTHAQFTEAANAGANLIVIGNSLESNPSKLSAIIRG
ncbi:MAG TPA: geranylgeranylglyceryl/heptaprenylglyceryl phosphate synthase [Bacteroidales bacterium]|nr:geranylgeranylglyceryl/heptaprenylglyceryl phosphate synthase [Bacteroidales bacterium]